MDRNEIKVIEEMRAKAVERLKTTLLEVCHPSMREHKTEGTVEFRHVLGNHYMEGGKALLALTHTDKNVKEDVSRLLEAIGGFRRALDRGDSRRWGSGCYRCRGG